MSNLFQGKVMKQKRDTEGGKDLDETEGMAIVYGSPEI
jgi:hypothetical protein